MNLTLKKLSRSQPAEGLWLGLAIFLAVSCAHSELPVVALAPNGELVWTNAPVPGVCTVEVATAFSNIWSPTQNAFSTVSTGALTVAMDTTNKFFRLHTMDVSATAQGFTNLIRSYGILETVAGTGEGRTEGVSYWQTAFEGGAATAASLSRPHYAMADRAGNLYIADKNSHSILRVDTTGLIHTHAGTHIGGFNGEGPTNATSLQLNFPNALWVRADGTVYVLDTDNGRVRRVDTNGLMATLFLAKADGTALSGGRMLWVKDDESLAYFGANDKLKKWTPADGVHNLATGFSELGTFYVEPGGDLIVADRCAHYVYRVQPNSSRSVIAGNGTTTGGGDGQPALATGFYGPRGVWPVPTGGYLLLLHDGAQLWYVDVANVAHLLVNGLGGNIFVHADDGQYFYAPDQFRIGEGRSVTMDHAGNIIVCESDYGYIRKVRFQRINRN